MKTSLRRETDWVWDARWASWWLSDSELFDFSAPDFNRKSRALRDAGVNAVITFGGFHCVWNYVDDWPGMLRMLRMLCSACRRNGIRVVEHHSAVGAFRPVGVDEREGILSMQKRLGVDSNRHPGFVDILNEGDAEYRGVKFSSMRQVDALTGEHAHKGPRHPFCHNNPDWQRLYFEHLADIYQCGVDGIMTDDIGFWGRGYSCGCLHCREKFRKDTGFEIPPVGTDDAGFYNNIDTPAGRAWVLWRIRCHREHQKRVYDHFRGQDLELARPMYCSSNTNSYAARGMGVALDNLDGYYSTIFTEVNEVEPQAHCWLRVGVESSQRTALARRNNVPPMCLFYPHNSEENLFCWAMTKTWGQNYWGTKWGMPLKEEVGMLEAGFTFEKKHPGLYECRDSIAEVGVLFSAKTVWLHNDTDAGPDTVRMSDPASTDCWAGWCEMLTLANIPYDTLGENDLEEGKQLGRFRLLIVPNAVCLSDKAIASLKKFAANGGSVIITHQSGMKNEKGEWRKKHPLSNLTGAKYKETLTESPTWIPVRQTKLRSTKCRYRKAPVVVFEPGRKTERLMELEGGMGPAVFHYRYGKGIVMTFAGKPGRVICVSRHKRIERFNPNTRKRGKRFAMIDFTMNKRVKTLMEAAVRSLLPDLPLKIEGVPEGFVLGCYRGEKRAVVHVTNAAGTLADNGKTVPIPSKLRFPRAHTLSGGNRTMTLKLTGAYASAVLRSPEFAGKRKLAVRKDGKFTVVELPDKLVRCYSVIEMDQRLESQGPR